MTDKSVIIGQDMIYEYFDRAIKNNRIPHALIISGEKGSGKLQIARQFAFDCLGIIYKEFHPDIKIIDLDEPGVKYTNCIREQLIDNLYKSPFSSDFKFYIITSAEKMPANAQNAILKSLEEPPEYASIIMLTDSPGKLLPTIKSRSVNLFIKPVKNQIITEFLSKKYGIEQKKASSIAGLSLGNIKKAEKMAENEDYLNLADEIGKVFSHVIEKKEHISRLEEISHFKENMYLFLELLEILFRDVLVYKSLENKRNLIYSGWEKSVFKIAENSSYNKINRILSQIKETRTSLEANVSKDLLTEMIMIETGGDL